jgi:hypothetical protein
MKRFDVMGLARHRTETQSQVRLARLTESGGVGRRRQIAAHSLARLGGRRLNG